MSIGTRTKKTKEQKQLEQSPSKPQLSGPRVTFGDPIIELPIGLLDRHPDNRQPAKQAIDERAESLQANGLLEPIVVRMLDSKSYQIVSGETRWLAAKKLGWESIKARIVECDDSQALQLLARYNADRKDLDPIERALLIEKLCQPQLQGGSGLTRAEAAKTVGLESASAASNLVRLLELPESWQKRVAAGELPESFARCLLKAVAVPGAMDELEEQWQVHLKDPDDFCDDFASRGQLEESVDRIIRENIRPLKKSASIYYSHSQVDNGGGRFGCEIPPGELEAHKHLLGIVTIDGEEVATKIELFDELNIEAIKSRQAKRTGKTAQAKSEKKADPKERKLQLNRQIGEWREALLRRAISAAVLKTSDEDPRTAQLLLFFLRNRGLINYSADVSECDTGTAAAVVLISGRAHGDRYVAGIDGPTLMEWARLYRIDLAAEWGKLQPVQASKKADAALIAFYNLHRKDELLPLGKELGVHLTEDEPKGKMVDRLAGKLCRMPKCLELPPAGKAKAKR